MDKNNLWNSDSVIGSKWVQYWPQGEGESHPPYWKSDKWPSKQPPPHWKSDKWQIIKIYEMLIQNHFKVSKSLALEEAKLSPPPFWKSDKWQIKKIMRSWFRICVCSKGGQYLPKVYTIHVNLKNLKKVICIDLGKLFDK